MHKDRRIALNTRMRARTRPRKHANIRLHMQKKYDQSRWVHARVHIFARKFVDEYIYIHKIHTYIHAHMHTYINTHTHTHKRWQQETPQPDTTPAFK